jgi:hypothetical protein
MAYSRLTVGEVKCVDDGETMGVHIATQNGIVTLIFKHAADHKQMGALATELRKLGLSEVIVE